jgi:hypothetical protein
MKTLGAVLIAFACYAAAQESQSQKDIGIRAFREMAAVLTSPRCLNCHVPGSGPLQGDDNHVHNMLVARGTDGKGTPAMRCSSCHQETNVSTPHAPPGASGWRMPTAATPMAWQGLTSTQLCRVLVDPATNGKRSLADLVEHVSSDKIVNWGWSPGPNRTVPPLSHQQFVEAVKSWVAAGGPCPE